MIERHGKKYALYAGLLDEAHSRGLRSIETELLQVPGENNGGVAICHAVVRTEEGKFTGIGDASPENVGRAIIPHIIRMAECVPLSTEILTRAGWKTHDEARVGEEVLAYDVGADFCRWTPLKGVSVFPEAEVVRVSSRSFDAVCTPDHKWAVKMIGSKGKPRALRPLKDVKTSNSIIVAAPAEGGDHELTGQEAAVLGWLSTDGTLRSETVGRFGPYPRAHIDQSKPEMVEELRGLLGTDAYETVKPEGERTFPSGVTYKTRQAHRFNLRSAFLRGLLVSSGLRDWKDLPGLVMRLSVPARRAMLDAMLKGDGHLRRGKRRAFGKKRKPGVMEAFEILATLEGVALGRPQLSSVGGVPVRTLRENRLVNSNYLTVLPESRTDVWCPTTRYGTWVMRDASGTISITGNTRAKARALRDAINVGTASLEELGPESDEDGPEGTRREARAPNPREAAARPHAATSREERQRASGQQKARKSQTDLLRTLAEELRGENGVARLEERIGKPLDELTRAEADEWIERLGK